MSDPSNVVATRNGSVQRDEINLINKELHKLQRLEEEAKLQILQKRVALLRRLNSVQASTRVLPPETLSYIILLLCHSNNVGRYSRALPRIVLKLGHVSSYWRQIIWSTPQLWSDLAMDVYSHNIHTVVPLLQLYLQNIASLSLNVGLFFSPELLSADESRDSIAFVLFHETNAAKIRSLDLYNAPWEWAPQLNNPNFSSLKCLNLTAFQGQREDSDLLDLAELPCLHDVVLTMLVVPTAVKLCWSKITSLDLEDIHIDVCLKLLTCCPNLIEFRCSDPLDRVDNLSTTPNHRLHDIITLNHLEIFEWTHDNDPCCLEVFRHLRLPALRDLTWTAWRTESEEGNIALLALASNLPQVLPSLTFTCSKWIAPFVKDVFRQIGRVERLILECCSEVTIANVFSTLTEDADAGGRPMLLSSLKTLAIQGVLEDGGSFDEEIGLFILPFLQNRFLKGCLEFHLEFVDLSMDWLSGIQEELCWMRREGFKLEIYHEFKRLDWFGAG